MSDINPVTRWLEGEISAGKLLQLEGVPHVQGACLLGHLWLAIHEKAYALDAKLESRIKVADEFAALAKSGDFERTVSADVADQARRAVILQEARSLLRLHLLGCLDRTGAAG